MVFYLELINRDNLKTRTKGPSTAPHSSSLCMNPNPALWASSHFLHLMFPFLSHGDGKSCHLHFPAFSPTRVKVKENKKLYTRTKDEFYATTSSLI